MDQIADDLTEDSHAETTQRVADYYMEKGLFDKSMELLVRTKKAEEALKLCQLHSVPLTEELVDKISVPQKDDGKGVIYSVIIDIADTVVFFFQRHHRKGSVGFTCKIN